MAVFINHYDYDSNLTFVVLTKRNSPNMCESDEVSIMIYEGLNPGSLKLLECIAVSSEQATNLFLELADVLKTNDSLNFYYNELHKEEIAELETKAWRLEKHIQALEEENKKIQDILTSKNTVISNLRRNIDYED